jgi:hypothetical protein
MPEVRFKDLCIDVTEAGGQPRRVATFWSRALQQPLVDHGDGSFHLDPPANAAPERRVWINTVAEPIATKSRVHLDLRADADGLDSLLRAGATVQRSPDDDIRWHVLHDPDGVAFCVMGPHPAAPDARGPFEIVVDAADPLAQATWWAQRTGGTVNRDHDVAWVWVTDAQGFPFDYWVFTPVPEPKRDKNRVHWDVTLIDADIDDLVQTGATLVREKDDEIDWWVLADPEGNEFCAFLPRD